MHLVPMPDCRFCLANQLLIDVPLFRLNYFFILGSIEPNRPHQAMIVPYRHIETPFDLEIEEWAEMNEALSVTKRHLENANPDGFTLGWNVGGVAGQDVFHAHLHVIARFSGEHSEGLGIHALFRSSRKE